MLSKLKTLFLIGFIVGLILLFWAVFIEPRLLETRKYKVSVTGLEGLKIVFLSDLHLAPGHEQKLKKIVDKVGAQNPDIILLGGDFAKGHKYATSMSADKIAAGLSQLKAKYGVFVVLGNHDSWYGGQKIEAAFAKHGLRVLKNENVQIDFNENSFFITGIEDFYTGTPDIIKAIDNTSAPVILLSHSPDVFPELPNTVDLTLAGHTHGGQVKMPFWGALITSSIYGTKYAEGLIHENGKKMIVTKGIGTSLLPLRFNCRPEIVVIDFM